MSELSPLETELLNQITAYGLPLPATEYHFHPERKWRFDFAYPSRKIGIEVEGGTWVQGRHSQGAGFEKDCEKYNQAALMGWIVLRYTGAMIADGRAIHELDAIFEDDKGRY